MVTDGRVKLTLYHHTDGYPEYMVPTIRKAFDTYCQGWEGNRVYKVASALCAVDPLVFEPLDYHELHSDIEFYYVVTILPNGGFVGEVVRWLVEVYEEWDHRGVPAGNPTSVEEWTSKK